MLYLPDYRTTASGAFDVENDITWHSLYWAEGTDFSAEGYSDEGTITNGWPNETSEANASTVNGTPTYEATWTAGNNQPAVHFESASSEYVRSGAFTSNPTYGITIVCIGEMDDNSAAHVLFDGRQGGEANNVFSNTQWRLGAGGTTRTGGSQDTDPHLWRARFTGDTGGEYLYVDETLTINNLDAGSQTITGITIGANRSGASPHTGHIALLGIYEGDLSSDGEWSNFKTWVTDHYGITLS